MPLLGRATLAQTPDTPGMRAEESCQADPAVGWGIWGSGLGSAGGILMACCEQVEILILNLLCLNWGKAMAVLVWLCAPLPSGTTGTGDASWGGVQYQ